MCKICGNSICSEGNYWEMFYADDNDSENNEDSEDEDDDEV
ncbi:MAG: hypothetical protein WC966_10680 [Bradymonadales bacterium]